MRKPHSRDCGVLKSHNKFGISKVFSLTKEKLKILALFSFGSSIASLINPNCYKTFLFPLFHERSLFSTIEEYHRPMLYEYHAYWFLVVLVIISILILIKKKKLDITELFLSVVLILPSLKSIRYIIFFALGTGVFLAFSTSYVGTQLKEFSPFKKFLNSQKFQRIDLKSTLSLLLIGVSIIILIKISISNGILR